MEAFFAITLSIIVLTKWWRSENREIDSAELRRNTVKARWDRKKIKAEKLKQEAKLKRKAARENRRLEDIENIAVIQPIIRNDK